VYERIERNLAEEIKKRKRKSSNKVEGKIAKRTMSREKIDRNTLFSSCSRADSASSRAACSSSFSPCTTEKECLETL
jgi:hypothetical protein